MTDSADRARMSRSGSPLPPAPIEATPGLRATALQNAFEKALEATLSKCSYDKFAGCFPTTAQNQPSTLQMFHSEFTGKLSEACKSEFDNILKDRSVVSSLNQLDRLINEAKSRRESAEQSGDVQAPTAPYMMSPDDLVNAHLANFLDGQQATLSSSLSIVQARNLELIDNLKAQESEIQRHVAALESFLSDLETSAALVQSSGTQSLINEIKMVEQELSAT